MRSPRRPDAIGTPRDDRRNILRVTRLRVTVSQVTCSGHLWAGDA